MRSSEDADKLARLIKNFARASYDDRRELRDRCGAELSFLMLYLNSIAMDDQPTFDGIEEDQYAKLLKVAYQGTVRTWDPSKGHGYITADDGTKVLIHITCLRAGGFQTLARGARVTFNQIVRESGKAQVFRVIAINARPDQ